MRTSWIYLVIALLPAAQAAEFDYTFAEVGYVDSELDSGGFDVDGDGLGINGSFAVNDRYFLFGGYSSLDFGFSVELNQITVGGGFHSKLSPTMDFVGKLAYLDAEVDTPFGSISEDGLGVGAGLRASVGPAFEWEAGLDYTDVGDSDISVRFDGRYHFTDVIAAGAGLTLDNDVTTFRLGVRMDFGQ